MDETSTATVNFRINSWLENAGIVGLMRILKNNPRYRKSYKEKENTLEVNLKVFNNFSDLYFNFFIKNYGQATRYWRIINEENLLVSLKENEFKDFDTNTLRKITNWFDNVLKYSVNSASYKKVIKFIDSDFDVKAEVKDCNKKIRTLNKKNFLTKSPDEAKKILQELTDQLLQIINYFSTDQARKYFPAKTLSYMVINKAWNGVSFLNPQAKNLDFYEDYQNYFVAPIQKYLQEDHSKDKYICSTCGRPMKRLEYSYGFLNDMGYDLSRKTSNAWNFKNDLYICPLCQFLYSLVPAGFTYNMAGQGIFINENSSIRNLQGKNDGIFKDMMRDIKDNTQTSPYRAFTAAFRDAEANGQKAALANIQLITYNNDHYSFQIIPIVASRVLTKAVENTYTVKRTGEVKNYLANLYNAGISDFRGTGYYSILDNVMNCLFNNTSLFSIIQELELLKVGNTNGCYYNTFQIMTVIRINAWFLNELYKYRRSESTMKVKDDKLTKVRGCGMHVRMGYDNENKAKTLAYKMLEAMRANSTDRFMELLLNAYLYLDKTVPKIFIETQSDTKIFREYAFAFIAGLIGNSDTEEDK
ncbi:type I-B CRISPR-associated protein Cas8b1/Cst1 [Lactobacillus acidophilus]